MLILSLQKKSENEQIRNTSLSYTGFGNFFFFILLCLVQVFFTNLMFFFSFFLSFFLRRNSRAKEEPSPDQFYIDQILNRHARKLLSSHRLRDLGMFSANMQDFQLVGWLRKER